MKEYVLVSQGMEIYRTKYKDEAQEMMDKSNKDWREYVERCIEEGDRPADNEVFLEEEDIDNSEIYRRKVILNDFANQMRCEYGNGINITKADKEFAYAIIDMVEKRLEYKYLNNYSKAL